jgi:hypothetical protein
MQLIPDRAYTNNYAWSIKETCRVGAMEMRSRTRGQLRRSAAHTLAFASTAPACTLSAGVVSDTDAKIARKDSYAALLITARCGTIAFRGALPPVPLPASLSATDATWATAVAIEYSATGSDEGAEQGSATSCVISAKRDK